MLSFTLVSHIGYMVFGVALATPARARRRDLLRRPPHHHPGHAVPRRRADRAGRAAPPRSTGWAGWPGVSPLLGVLFFVPAMNLAGIPPLSGFIGKLGLLQAGVADGTPIAWVLVVAGVADLAAHPVRHGEGLEPGVLGGRSGLRPRVVPQLRLPRARPAAAPADGRLDPWADRPRAGVHLLRRRPVRLRRALRVRPVRPAATSPPYFRRARDDRDQPTAVPLPVAGGDPAGRHLGAALGRSVPAEHPLRRPARVAGHRGVLARPDPVLRPGAPVAGAGPRCHPAAGTRRRVRPARRCGVPAPGCSCARGSSGWSCAATTTSTRSGSRN